MQNIICIDQLDSNVVSIHFVKVSAKFWVMLNILIVVSIDFLTYFDVI